MHSFYFGKSRQPLYGVVHNPSGENYRNSAILLCNSVGYENMRCHRELKRLANQLSESGYYVLRFDYSGVGDSSGVFEEKNMSDWQEDICRAKEELGAISGVPFVDCIGIRVGATLACNALHNDAGIRKLLLWDPVIDGEEYLRTINKLQDELMLSPMWFQVPRDRNKIPGNEFLGYRYSQKLIDQLGRGKVIDDLHMDVSRLLHIYTKDDVVNRQFTTGFDGVEHTSEFLDDMGNWDELGSIDSSLTANQIVNRVMQEFV